MRYFIIFLSLVSTFLVDAQEQRANWSDLISIQNEDLINSPSTEFSPAFWGDLLVFVQARERQKLLDKQTNEPFFDLVFCQKNNGTLSQVKTFDSTINTPYHEGPAHFSPSGDEIYFTRVDYDGSEFNIEKDKTVTLKIFHSIYENGSWAKPIKISLNEPDVASCHPTLNYDKNLIVFASDRPGGYGKMDLYKSYYENGNWSAPINLGPDINSEENDWFPSINERGLLFFASDRTDKNLDIYLCEGLEENWSAPKSLPTPLNTIYDDFGLITDKNAMSGYLSSNRPGGQGKDDLYQFSSQNSLYEYVDSTYNLISLKVTNEAGQALSQAEVTVHSLDESDLNNFNNKIFNPKADNFLLATLTNIEGESEVNLDSGYKLISIQAQGKEQWQQIISAQWGGADYSITLKNLPEEKVVEPQIIYIEKEVPAPSINNVKVEAGAVIVFENIYYEYGSTALTRGAEIELNKLIDLMHENSKLRIQMSAHTDCRGKEDFNLDLSNKRAESAKNYMITNGIGGHRIEAVGYGESQPRNHCVDGVQCSEAEHIYNRRTEVKILEN